MYEFANLDRVGNGAAPQGGYDRVGYGPQLVGVQSGPAIVGVGAGPMAAPPGHPGHMGHGGPRNFGPMGPPGGWGHRWSPIGYGPFGYAASTPYPYSGF